MTRPRLQNLALVAITLVICLGAAEAFFRLFPQFLGEEAVLRLHWQQLDQSGVDQRMTVPDRRFGYLYRPNFTGRLSRGALDFSFTTDEHGFRNPSPWPARADIVVVGDSMAFGYGVGDAQAWPRLVADALPNLKVINLGLIGASPQQYLRLLESFGLPLHPKLVLFMLFSGNDLYDTREFQEWVDAATNQTYQEWEVTSGHPPDSGWLQRLLESSRLIAFLRGSLRSLTAGTSTTVDFEDGGHVRLAPGMLRSSIEMAHPGDPVFERAMTTIERARDLTQQQGGHFLVLLMPSKEEVYLPRTGQPAPPLASSLKAALAKRGIDTLDLTPPLQAHASDPAPLFYEIDGHPNANGYRLIARLVVDHLKEFAQSYGLTDQPGQQKASGAG
jgi:lysophospholipase L1-like esterase